MTPRKYYLEWLKMAVRDSFAFADLKPTALIYGAGAVVFGSVFFFSSHSFAETKTHVNTLLFDVLCGGGVTFGIVFVISALLAPYRMHIPDSIALDDFKSNSIPRLELSFDPESRQHNAGEHNQLKRIELRNNSNATITGIKAKFRSVARLSPNPASIDDLIGAPIPIKHEELGAAVDLGPLDHVDLNIMTLIDSGREMMFHFYEAAQPIRAHGQGVSREKGRYHIVIEARADNHGPVSIDLLAWWSKKGRGELLMRTIPASGVGRLQALIE